MGRKKFKIKNFIKENNKKKKILAHPNDGKSERA